MSSGVTDWGSIVIISRSKGRFSPVTICTFVRFCSFSMIFWLTLPHKMSVSITTTSSS